MVQKVLRPGMQHRREAQGGLEVVPAELQQGGAGAGEQESVEPCLVVLEERVQVVREGEHDMEVRDGQQVLGLLLQPLGALQPLAARTVPVAAGVRCEVLAPAVGTPILMAAQRRSVTGGEGAQDLPVMRGQTMGPGKLRQGLADDLAQGEGLRLPGRRATGHTVGRSALTRFGGRG